MKLKSAGLIIACIVIGAQQAGADPNRALLDWQAFANTSSDVNHQRWVEAISDQRAQKLAADWKALRGYDAHQIISKSDLPADLKPGLVINRSNVDQYEWLADYLPKDVLDSLRQDSGFVRQISIVPSNTYYLSRGVFEATQAFHTAGLVAQTNEAGTLVNPDGSFTFLNDSTASAIPYLHPENGLELSWSFVAHGAGTESLKFDPMITSSCNKKGFQDVRYKGVLWWQKFHGRHTVEPLGSVPYKEGLVEGGALYILAPKDVQGIAAVRQRYADGAKQDDFRIYLPSMGRTRILSGSDTQDPMYYGLEVSWDDWRAYWGKTDLAAFDYEMLGERLILASPETGYVYRSAKIGKSECYWENMEMELRPVWVLRITDKTGTYQYKTRTLYIDQENFGVQYQEMTDARGEDLRTWDDSRSWRPFDGDGQWDHLTVHNLRNNRLNIMRFNSVWKDRAEQVSEDNFDIDQLRDY